MEYREGYTTERYNGNNIHQYNDEYSNNIYLVFFGILIICGIISFCGGKCGSWWEEELNEPLIDDRVIMNIKKNIKKYENINKNINEVCVICLDEYCSKDNILILDCTHYYHSECLIDWFKKNPSYTCPLCRSETI